MARMSNVERAQAVGMIRAAPPSDRLLGFSIGDISVLRLFVRNSYKPEVLQISDDAPISRRRLPYRIFKLSMTTFRIVLPRHVIQWVDTTRQSTHKQHGAVVPCGFRFLPQSTGRRDNCGPGDICDLQGRTGPMFYLLTRHASHYAGMTSRCNQISGSSRMLFIRCGGHSTTVSSQIHYINEDKVPCCNCHSRWTYKVLKRNQLRRDLILQFWF